MNVATVIRHGLSSRKNTHYHVNIRTKKHDIPIDNWHTHSTRFTEPRMSARHQCEASTMAPRGTLRNSGPRLMPQLPLPIPTPWSWRCWQRRLPVLVFVLAAVAAAVVVARLWGKAKAKAYNTRIAPKPHTAAAAALSMSQPADVLPIGRRLSLQPQNDLRPTDHTPPWSAV